MVSKVFWTWFSKVFGEFEFGHCEFEIVTWNSCIPFTSAWYEMSSVVYKLCPVYKSLSLLYGKIRFA